MYNAHKTGNLQPPPQQKNLDHRLRMHWVKGCFQNASLAFTSPEMKRITFQASKRQDIHLHMLVILWLFVGACWIALTYIRECLIGTRLPRSKSAKRRGRLAVQAPPPGLIPRNWAMGPVRVPCSRPQLYGGPSVKEVARPSPPALFYLEYHEYPSKLFQDVCCISLFWFIWRVSIIQVKQLRCKTGFKLGEWWGDSVVLVNWDLLRGIVKSYELQHQKPGTKWERQLERTCVGTIQIFQSGRDCDHKHLKF